ncbi:unnamed protein product [Caenorhabditis auriculariae]|uniref:Phosphatidic acid phosphatase type 2/haloperoxidase domain-containing protein n=1 Tax=Caenorhabditis auriculariae TaxID=2777116 RepID=A0A8S1H8Y4_9PELO|nr:unnamed protein product [Caenorhabditis auriculariae]
MVISAVWVEAKKKKKSSDDRGPLMAVLDLLRTDTCPTLCLPRPPTPPAVALSEEARDWAWPSNHALLGTAFPWFIWIYASNHYDLSILASLFLLCGIIAWNTGVSWSRIYLSVHSPCDVLAGWTIGVLLLFIFEGFSDKLHAVYVKSSPTADLSFFGSFYAFFLFLLWLHPRSWPETQSYGEVVCVLSGAAAMWTTRILHFGSDLPFQSLLEIRPEAPIYHYVARLFVGAVALLATRLVLKPITKKLVTTLYDHLSLRYYSYSEYCKILGDQLQPTKRYTQRLRFKPIPGEKVINIDDVPYDVDLPVKFIVYSAIGFMVTEGCPSIFARLGI